MDKGVLGEDGAIRCPKCRSTSFRLKRSFKAKAGIGVIGVATLGVGAAAGALAAPKRVKCLACGELYKARAEPPRPPAVPAPAPAVMPPPRPAELPPGEQSTEKATLRLKRAFAMGPILDEVQLIRPDLSREQAKDLVKATKAGPQVLLTGRSRAEMERAATRLRKFKIDHEII